MASCLDEWFSNTKLRNKEGEREGGGKRGIQIERFRFPMFLAMFLDPSVLKTVKQIN